MPDREAGSSSDDAPRADGDRVQAFAAQFNTRFRPLWLIAVGIVQDASTAEDVVQEAALIALSKLNEFRPGTSLDAWLGQIVRNVARNSARKERKRRARTIDPAAMDHTEPEGPHDDERVTAQPCFDARIMRALDAVSETARACLLLRTIEGLEYSKIAELLGIPAGTAMSHVHRTRRYLRERLSQPPSEDPEVPTSKEANP